MAVELAREMVRLGTHFFQCWLDAGCAWDLQYDDDHTPPESLPFLEWSCSIPAGREDVWRAIHELRGLRPIARPGAR